MVTVRTTHDWESKPAEPVIDSFRDEYLFLSNFYRSRLTFDGEIYATAEHAFQASKTMDLDLRDMVKACKTAREAKTMGKTLPLRDDWERIKYEMMYQVQIAKYTHADRAWKLRDTGDAILIEGNTWCDQVWGACWCGKHPGKGKNALGRILMLLRTELQAQRTGQTAPRPWIVNWT